MKIEKKQNYQITINEEELGLITEALTEHYDNERFSNEKDMKSAVDMIKQLHNES